MNILIVDDDKLARKGLIAVIDWEQYGPVSYTHLRAHETRHDLVCRLLLEKKKETKRKRMSK